MEISSLLSKTPLSVADLRKIVRSSNEPIVDGMNKNSFINLLQGFKLIVTDFIDGNEETKMEDAFNWLHFYMKIQSVVKAQISYRNKTKILKSLPIILTYVIGWLQHGPSREVRPYAKIIKTTEKLIMSSDLFEIKGLEKCGSGVIFLLWNTLGKLKNFNLQKMILNLFHSFLFILSKEFSCAEIERISNIDSVTRGQLLRFIETHNSDREYSSMIRKILNNHNFALGFQSAVQSFHCSNVYIGEKLKFSKAENDEKLWIDICINPCSLLFTGCCKRENDPSPWYANVSISDPNFSHNGNVLKIDFHDPAEVEGLYIDYNEWNNIKVAYAELAAPEMIRFLQTFNVSSHHAEIPAAITTSLTTNTENNYIEFKIPSLEKYESAVRPKRSMAAFPNKEPGRFFKNPRQSPRIGIPWKNSAFKAPRKVRQSNTNPSKPIRRLKTIQQAKPLRQEYKFRGSTLGSQVPAKRLFQDDNSVQIIKKRKPTENNSDCESSSSTSKNHTNGPINITDTNDDLAILSQIPNFKGLYECNAVPNPELSGHILQNLDTSIPQSKGINNIPLNTSKRTLTEPNESSVQTIGRGKENTNSISYSKRLRTNRKRVFYRERSSSSSEEELSVIDGRKRLKRYFYSPKRSHTSGTESDDEDEYSAY